MMYVSQIIMLHTLNLCSAVFQLYIQKFVRKNKNRLEFLLDLPNSNLPPPSIPICSTPAAVFYYSSFYLTLDVLISLLISQHRELLLRSQLLHCCLTVRNSFPEIYVGLTPSFYLGLYSNTTFSEMPSLNQTILKYHLACYLRLLILSYFLFRNTFHH